MTAATITPAMAGADLLTALRELVQRHDGAESPEDVATLLDDVTVALRRARGRVNRFAKKQASPKAAPKPVPAKPPAQPRADGKLPPEPKPQQERPPRPPKEAPETPPEPRRSRWPGRLNTALLALVCAVIALILGGQAVVSLVARTVRPVCRRAVALARAAGSIFRRFP